MSAKSKARRDPTNPTTDSRAVTPAESSDSGPGLIAQDIGAATHTGYVRKNNEDHYLVVRFQRSLENLLTNLDETVLSRSFSSTGYGMLVADGMGGMAAGEVASGTALARLVELVVETPDWIMLMDEEAKAIVLGRMRQRFLEIDKTLKAQVKRDPSLSGMGTTLTLAASLGEDLIIGHIGDSRAYLLRDNNLNQLTRDHTLAQALIDAKLAKPNDPNTRSMRHVLTTAMGALKEGDEPQLHRLRLSAGDQLLLCTDGLTDMIDDSAIATALREASSAQSACEHLIHLALVGGGSDNISAIVARFG